ncbi:hypothetical protein QC764_404840 [Podospora pseudoanserina]|uniref:Mid2 domain-containing protein n=1 Tax=Podospora pseudoanserina TaxID=2609844 RepID=A0ABR0IBH2_9PEZI|nr:hypothetical protein QC764_404840 [Podospora pseudoanserina]
MDAVQRVRKKRQVSSIMQVGCEEGRLGCWRGEATLSWLPASTVWRVVCVSPRSSRGLSRFSVSNRPVHPEVRAFGILRIHPAITDQVVLQHLKLRSIVIPQTARQFKMRYLPKVALATIVSSLFLPPAFSLPQAGSVPDAAPLPWVTINPQGDAETIIPKVITTDGHRATLSNPPAHLISTATYTLSPDGRLSTYTGLAPVATATTNPDNNNNNNSNSNNDDDDDDESAAFLACQSDKGHDEPFCLPRRGSSLIAGRTYYITWSPSYFSPQSTPLTLHASTSPPSPSPPRSASTPGPSPNFPTTSPISFALQHNDTTTEEANDIVTVSGPTVNVFSSDPNPEPSASGDGNGTNHLAIVLPIVIIAILIGLAGFCFLFRRRKGRWPVIGERARSSGSGYTGQGGRRVQEDQVGGGVVTGDNKSETNIGVELTDRDSWSPTSPNSPSRGRNVFREEVERQERLARGG